MSYAAAQFLSLADPRCDLSTINDLFAGAGTACPDYAAALCPPACALAMAPLAYGDCARTVTGLVDQSEGGAPDGLAQTLQRQLTACVASNRPRDLAAAAAATQGCAVPDLGPPRGGHRRMDGDLIPLGNVTETRNSRHTASGGSQRRRAQASAAEV
eukprot:SAG22_NODE_3353_length_1761_cov_12.768953_2_plen_157_part_00